MAIPLPKIVWNPGTGAITLSFTYPPVQKPGADPMSAKRNDVKSGGGLLQSNFEYMEVFRTLQMDYAPMDGLTGWSSFMYWALSGGAFDYYPDATSGAHDTWTLADTDWTPAYNFRTMSKFKFKMRKQTVNQSDYYS